MGTCPLHNMVFAWGSCPYCIAEGAGPMDWEYGDELDPPLIDAPGEYGD